MQPFGVLDGVGVGVVDGEGDAVTVGDCDGDAPTVIEGLADATGQVTVRMK